MKKLKIERKAIYDMRERGNICDIGERGDDRVDIGWRN